MLKTALLIILRVGIVVGLGFGLILFFLQDSMIYMPSGYDDLEVDAAKKQDVRLLSFGTSEGRQTAFYLPPTDPTKKPEKVWIVCGGNGARALDYLDTVLAWNPGWGYLFIDYPGYGLCEGDPSPKGIRENTTGAIETLAAELDWGREEIGRRFCAFGHSIGAAAVLQAAEDFHMKRAVVIAPFTSTMDLAKASVGVPFCYVLRHRFDNLATLGQIGADGGRVIVFHGDRDSQIPVAMSRTLAEEFPDTVTYVEVKGGDHNRIVDMLKRDLKAAANGAGDFAP